MNLLKKVTDFQFPLENVLGQILGINPLKVGIQTLRNEKGFRENEKYIESNWITSIEKRFTDGHLKNSFIRIPILNIT